HEVVRLARISRDDDLLGRDAQELGERLACRFAPVAELRTVVERRIAIHVLGRAVEGLENRSGRRTQVRRVEHREIVRHHELAAYRLPVRLIELRWRRRKADRPRPFDARHEEWRRAADGEKPREFTTIHVASFSPSDSRLLTLDP